MKVFNVTVEGVVSVFAEDDDDAIDKVRSMLHDRADLSGQLRAIHAAQAGSHGGGYQPATDGSGRVPPGEE